MATKADLITSLQSRLDTAAGDMVAAAESFRSAYVAAHGCDLAIHRLGGPTAGQRLDGDKLHTLDTPAHASYRNAECHLFDGARLQPDIEQHATSIIDGLRAAHSEAF